MRKKTKKLQKISQSITTKKKNASLKKSNSYKQKKPTLDRVMKTNNFNFPTSYKTMTTQLHKQKIYFKIDLK